jgi:hypothetical protein
MAGACAAGGAADDEGEPEFSQPCRGQADIAQAEVAGLRIAALTSAGKRFGEAVQGGI